MFAERGPRPWWEQFEIVIHFDGKQLRTRCGIEATQSRKFFLVTHPAAELLQWAEADGPAEVHFEGTRFRVVKYRDKRYTHGGVHLVGEPVGTVGVTVSSTRPSIQEQVLEALRSAAGGMTARQVQYKLECSRRAVFAALSALAEEGRATKDGSLYRAGE
ncbi:MAG: hypothetical protein WBE45_00445 [Terriglobales bacterium]